MAPSTTTALPPGVPDMLRAAHQVFVNLTTDRILRIETLAQAVRKGQDAPGAMVEIAQIAHQIAGVAGTLGYPEIGEDARQVEQRLKADLAAGDPLRHWEENSEIIEALLDALEDLE